MNGDFRTHISSYGERMADSAAVCVGNLLREAACGNDVAQQICRCARRSSHGRPINVQKAELFRIALGPFEIVHKTPVQIAAQIGTLLHRLMYPFEGFPQIPAASPVIYLCHGVAMFGDDKRQRVFFGKFFENLAHRARTHAPSGIGDDGLCRARIRTAQYRYE